MPGRFGRCRKLGLTTPWAREGITKADREEVEAAIPDGWQLGVSVTPNKQSWVFWTVSPEGNVSHKTHVSHHMALRAACFFVLNHRGLLRSHDRHHRRRGVHQGNDRCRVTTRTGSWPHYVDVKTHSPTFYAQAIRDEPARHRRGRTLEEDPDGKVRGRWAQGAGIPHVQTTR